MTPRPRPGSLKGLALNLRWKSAKRGVRRALCVVGLGRRAGTIRAAGHHARRFSRGCARGISAICTVWSSSDADVTCQGEGGGADQLVRGPGACIPTRRPGSRATVKNQPATAMAPGGCNTLGGAGLAPMGPVRA